MCINWIRWFIWRILTNRVDLSECFKGCVCVCGGGSSFPYYHPPYYGSVTGEVISR